MDFEWDAAKAEINERKHGLSFEVAVQVFEDSERIERRIWIHRKKRSAGLLPA